MENGHSLLGFLYNIFNYFAIVLGPPEKNGEGGAPLGPVMAMALLSALPP